MIIGVRGTLSESDRCCSDRIIDIDLDRSRSVIEKSSISEISRPLQAELEAAQKRVFDASGRYRVIQLGLGKEVAASRGVVICGQGNRGPHGITNTGNVVLIKAIVIAIQRPIANEQVPEP